MNKKTLVWLFAGAVMAGCATPKAADGKVDACKLTKPPKDSYVMEVPHGGYSYTYPDLSKGIGHYTGCMKTWFGDEYYLFSVLKLKNGAVYHAEIMEPGEEKVVCEFDKNRMLTKGSYDACKEYSDMSVRGNND